MFKPLFSALVLTLFATSTACVSTGNFSEQGYQHKRLGYSIDYANPATKNFIDDNWKMEKSQKGEPNDSDYGMARVEAMDTDGKKHDLFVKEADIILKHKLTNGVISVQSFPLNEFLANKKLSIFAKDISERLAGQYFVAFGQSNVTAGISKNLITNMVETKAGTLGSAETLEGVVEVANAEQLKLNPNHRLLRYKFLVIRPKPEKGWVETIVMRDPKNNVQTTYPAIIILVYSMDDAYYKEYVADFDSLVKRLKLKE